MGKGKAEVGSRKWLANKMKAAGLQKLRWYCQMCEKQCRDENGFKCHRMSEQHQRQMQLFIQKPKQFMDEFSQDFESSFMRIVSTKYCRTRILANTVYCEMIADKQHIHMNSTVWVTLSEFVRYLGRQGMCKIEWTPKGWYIEYIDNEKIEREKRLDAQRKADMTADMQNQQRIDEAIGKAKEAGGFDDQEQEDLFKRKDSEKVVFKFASQSKVEAKEKNKKEDKAAQDTDKEKNKNTNVLAELYKNSRSQTKSVNSRDVPPAAVKARKVSALDRLMIQATSK